MTSEEEALVWQALATIPETYREPLVLFYRAHRSVAEVAENLELSEDAVKQRLSRGRALLTERVLAVVEGALEQSRPSQQFTVGVMALVLKAGPVAGLTALPSAKAIATGTRVGAISSGLGLLTIPAALGSVTGWLMRKSPMQSDEERLSISRMWQSTVIATAVVVVPTFVLLALFGGRGAVRSALTIWLSIAYVAVGVPFAVWAWQNHLRVRGAAKLKDANGFARPLGFTWFVLLAEAVLVTLQYRFPSGHVADIPLGFAYLLLVMPFAARAGTLIDRGRSQTQRRPRTLVWVAIATAVMATLFMVSVLDMGGWRSVRISFEQARELVANRPDAKAYVLEYTDGRRLLEVLTTISADEKQRELTYIAPLSVGDFNSLNSEHVHFKLLRQGENFELLGTPGRLLFLLSAVVAVAGVVLLGCSACDWWKQRRSALQHSAQPSGAGG